MVLPNMQIEKSGCPNKKSHIKPLQWFDMADLLLQ